MIFVCGFGTLNFTEFISSNIFFVCVESLGFSVYKMLSSAEKFYFFSIYMKIFISFYFLGLISLVRASSTKLNSSGKSGHHCLVPHLRGKTFGLSLMSMSSAQFCRSVMSDSLKPHGLYLQETSVRFLGREGPLEKGKATHSVFWSGEFHGLYSPWGCKESDRTEPPSLCCK